MSTPSTLLATFPSPSSTTTPKTPTGRALVSLAAPGVWVLGMENVPDNRLTPLLPALDYIELAWHRSTEALRSANKAGGKKDKGPLPPFAEGALVLTGERGVGKFFSNGLQLECLKEYPTFFRDYYYRLLWRLLTFPLYTIAAINGHCFAGGLCLALACDERVCRPDRTWLSMNELQFGAPIPPGMSALLSARLPSPQVTHEVLCTARRYTAPEALESGIVDVVCGKEGSEGCVEEAVARAVGARRGLAVTGVLHSMRSTIYASTLRILAQDETLRLGEPQREMGRRFDELKVLEKEGRLGRGEGGLLGLVKAEGMAKL
ncbi:hypothetical protein JCM6882_002187 [Rhodosporidiobolus microsporus]